MERPGQAERERAGARLREMAERLDHASGQLRGRIEGLERREEELKRWAEKLEAWERKLEARQREPGDRGRGDAPRERRPERERRGD